MIRGPISSHDLYELIPYVILSGVALFLLLASWVTPPQKLRRFAVVCTVACDIFSGIGSQIIDDDVRGKTSAIAFERIVFRNFGNVSQIAAIG